MNYRPERVQSLIQEELGKLLLKEIEFPGIVTITGVDVDKHLDIARVKLSVLPLKHVREPFFVASVPDFERGKARRGGSSPSYFDEEQRSRSRNQERAVEKEVSGHALEKKALAIATKAEKYLQHLLRKRINIKPMPQIRFEIDYGAENAAQVEKLLIDEHNKEE